MIFYCDELCQHLKKNFPREEVKQLLPFYYFKLIISHSLTNKENSNFNKQIFIFILGTCWPIATRPL